MSGLDSLLDRLRQAYAAIGEVEETAAHFPGDRFVLANLASLKRDANELEALWQEECRNSKKEVCRYRLLPQSRDRFAIADVSKSLLDFQYLFSQIYSAIKIGARQRTRIAVDIANESELDFAFAYPGSLGIAMTVDSDTTLFGDQYDSAIDEFLNIMSIESEDAVRQIANNLGEAVVKRTYDWSKANSLAGYSVDVIWIKTDGRNAGAMIELQALTKIVDIIAATSDKVETPLKLKGVLKGIDAESGKYHFLGDDETHYRGSVAKEFDLLKQWAINTFYTAHLVEVSVTHYATQETKLAFVLDRLITDQTA